MNKNKQTIMAFVLIGSVTLTVLIAVTLLTKTAKELSIAVENRKVELINKSNEEAYANTKSVLLQLKETNVDTISLSAIYYLLANSGADIVVTGVATSDTMAVSTVPEDVVDTTIQPEQSTAEVVQPDQTAPTTAEQVPTQDAGQTSSTVTEVTQSEQTQQEAVDTPEVEKPKLPETKTGNPSVILTVRGDINSLLTYLDTTKLRYKIMTFNEHEKIKTCSIEIRR